MRLLSDQPDQVSIVPLRGARCSEHLDVFVSEEPAFFVGGHLSASLCVGLFWSQRFGRFARAFVTPVRRDSFTMREEDEVLRALLIDLHDRPDRWGLFDLRLNLSIYLRSSGLPTTLLLWKF
jgi:hypothetical protein